MLYTLFLAAALGQQPTHAILEPVTAIQTKSSFQLTYDLGAQDEFELEFWGPQPFKVVATFDGQRPKNHCERYTKLSAGWWISNLYGRKVLLTADFRDSATEFPDWRKLKLKAVGKAQPNKSVRIFHFEVINIPGVVDISEVPGTPNRLVLFNQGFLVNGGKLTAQGKLAQDEVAAIAARLRIQAVVDEKR